MKIINCTPHPISIRKRDYSFLSLPKATVIPRLETVDTIVDIVDGIEIHKMKFNNTIDLPEKKDGTILVVSRMVVDANPDRDDLVSPGSAIRDENGIIIGCEGLSK